jgi:peptidyl-prolyl cis-trans isomerase C
VVRFAAKDFHLPLMIKGKNPMKIDTCLLKLLVPALCFALSPVLSQAESQVLATIGSSQVTSDELNTAMASSPFVTQVTAMNEDDQASLRGDMLRRLVAARLLALEARRLGLDRTKTYQHDIDRFRQGLLYRFYMDKLRERIVIPADTLAAMKQQFKGDPDGLAAAKMAYAADQYQHLKLTTLQNLQRLDNVKLYEERIKTGIKAKTVLMEGKSFRIRYSDIVDAEEYPTLPNPEWVKEQLYNRGELLLVAQVAEREGVNVSEKLEQYRSEHLPALMLESKTREWIPGEKTLHEWFAQHPEVAVVQERRHVGQLVLATRKEAEAMRARINKGESLFTLAGQYSIDTIGRKQNGDMGWFVEGRGMPELNDALSKLETGELSQVIETKVGFHLLTILEREPGSTKTYTEMRDRIKQMIVNEKLPVFLGELEGRHQVSWKVIQTDSTHVPKQPVM